MLKIKMIKLKGPKKNFLFNLIYQLLVLIIPLITAPYLSRVVGAEGVGIYSYTYSIVYYFMLLTMLGINNYGNRSIAKSRENKSKLSKTFWSIYIIQVCMGIIMLTLYFIYLNIFNVKYKNYAIIESLFIVSAIFDINWFFFGTEEFKKTIIRNTIIKVLNVVLIFISVKDKNDLWKYVFIMSFMTFLSQVSLWPFLKRKINIIKIKFSDIKEHIKPIIVLFIPVVAVSLYKMMDKIMLGSFISVEEVAFYENAEKIISIPMTIIAALGTVMLPRVSNIVAKGDDELVEKYMDKSLKFVSFLSFAMCMGLIAIGKDFAPAYFGDSFKKTGALIMILSVTMPFISYANVLRTQFLIPKEMDKVYIKSVSLGAIVNLILNLLLIPLYSSVGACIGTICAEIIVMFYQLIYVNKSIKEKKSFLQEMPFFIKSIIMFAFIYPLKLLNLNSIIIIIMQIMSGIFIYCLLNIKYLKGILNYKK